jgi:hypothetical protein
MRNLKLNGVGYISESAIYDKALARQFEDK